MVSLIKENISYRTSIIKYHREIAPNDSDRFLHPIEHLEESVAACLGKNFCNNVDYVAYDVLFTVTYSNNRFILKCGSISFEELDSAAKKCFILNMINVPYEIKCRKGN